MKKKKKLLVSFSASVDPRRAVESKSGRYNLRRVPVAFRAGDYPDKKFSMTPRELQRAVRSFGKPIDMDSEHRGSVFDGNLGKLVGLEMNGKDAASAYVAVPKWFEEVVPPEKQAVSLSFDKASKKIVGMAWTHNPRVTEAKMQASFSADVEENGELEEIKDVEDEFLSQFSDEDADDEVVDDEDEDENEDAEEEDEEEEEGEEDEDDEDSGVDFSYDEDDDDPLESLSGKPLMDTIFKLASKGFDECDPAVNSDQFKKKLKKIVNLSRLDDDTEIENVDDIDEDEDEEKPKNKKSVEQPAKKVGFNGSECGDKKSMKKKKKKKKAMFSASSEDPRVKALLKDRRVRISSEAATFADDLIRGERILPRKKNAVIRGYVSAAEEDLVNFSVTDGSDGPNLSQFKAKLSARKPLAYFSESLTEDERKIVSAFSDSPKVDFSGDDSVTPPSGATLSESRRRELLSYTSVGREAWNELSKKN